MYCIFQSIIITVADGELFVDGAMKSIIDQSVLAEFQIECIVFLDYCIDQTEAKIESWRTRLMNRNINLIIVKNSKNYRLGVGYGRNRAIEHSRGEYLCFLDIDDVMYPRRIELQLAAAKNNQNGVGSYHKYDPWKPNN